MLINFVCVADRIQKQVFLCRPLIGAMRGSEKATASLQMNEVPVERDGKRGVGGRNGVTLSP